MTNMEKDSRNPGTLILNILLYIALLAVFILPRMPKLGQYVTPDENLWFQRSANFYYALGQRDYAHTFQREHPGVLPMWAGTLGFLQVYPQYRGTGAGYFDSSGLLNMFLEEHQADPLTILVAGRAAVVWICGLTLLATFAVLRRLVGLPGALLAYSIIAFDPFYFGLTRLLHLDAMLASFMLLSLTAFVAYLRLGRRWTYLLLSAVTAALSWLTKSPALFLIPTVGLLALLDGWPKEEPGWLRQLWVYARPLLVWGLAGLAVFVLLWPSMWVHPVSSVKAIFNLATTYAEEGHLQFFYGQVGMVTFPWWYYPVMFLWRATPAVLVGLALAAAALWQRWGLLSEDKVRKIVRDGLIFALLFMVFMHVGAKKFDRYMLPSQLWLDLIASLGWVSFIQWAFKENAGDKRQVVYQAAAVAAILASQVLLVYNTRPYYITYYNPWMGGLTKAAQVQTVGWGEGLEQAAAYLNTEPDAYKLDVMSWYGFGSLSYYFQGKVSSISPSQDWDRENAEKLREADYVVVYINQRQRSITRDLLVMLDEVEPDFVFQVGGLDYVWIYDLADAPPDQLQALRQFGE
jgi:4-amino-4-deoxy-L-arabinose transferase-like glycosyltransferase